ncbi:MAG: ATP-binding protein [Anaerolineae bacterium]
MTANWSLLGHEWAVDLLQQQVAQGTMRHAYLFTGPPGVGRRTLGLRFAQALNCQQPLAPGQPCGVCRNCVQIARLQHPDLIVTEAPEGKVVAVEQVRNARSTLVLKPYQSRMRVALFPRFHDANPNAANALLKTLEEAPSYAVLILTADAPEQLLPTIVSRCEVLRLRPVPVETVEAFLSERMERAKAEGKELPGGEAGARLIAHISGGRPGYAVRLLEDPAALAFRAEKLADLKELLAGTRASRFAYADRLAGDKDSLRNALLLWLSFWRDVLLCAGGAEMPPANVDRIQDIQTLARRLPLAKARRIVADLERALERLDANVNARLLAEVLLLDWPKA